MSTTPLPPQATRPSSASSRQSMPLAVDADLLRPLRAGMSRRMKFSSPVQRPDAGGARRFLGCGDESADAVQEAFCSAFQAIDSFEGTSALSTWLHRIVVQRTLMNYELGAGRPTVSIDDLLPAFDETGHSHSAGGVRGANSRGKRMERVETQNQVRACIDQLPTTTAWCFCSATSKSWTPSRRPRCWESPCRR